MRQLSRRLNCDLDRRELVVAAFGGSVTAGELMSGSWLEIMSDAWPSLHPDTRAIRFIKLASTALGPQYLSECFERHLGIFGGVPPDVVIAEYAVNDNQVMFWNRPPHHMEALARRLAAHGTLLLLLHHFTPAFLPGAGGYASRARSAEMAHESLARAYELPSASLLNATGLQSAWSNSTVPAMPICSFACAYGADHIHPTACGQRWLAQLGAHALERVLSAAQPVYRPAGALGRVVRALRCSWARRSAAREPERRATPKAIEDGGRGSSRSQGAMGRSGRDTCWSMTGERAQWNLAPSAIEPPGSWYVKAIPTQRGAGVLKNVWTSRTVGARVSFAGVGCEAQRGEAVRVMHLTGRHLRFGHVSAEIDGRAVRVLNGYDGQLGTIYVSAMLPLRNTSVRSSHVVSFVVLNATSVPLAQRTSQEHGGLGFGLSALMCAQEGNER